MLTQAICTFHQGRMVDRTDEALQHGASGTAVDPELLPHSSPVVWAHSAFPGDFLLDRAASGPAVSR